MKAVSVTFLILQIIIIGLGIFISYKRGLGRATVRFIYLAVIGIATFFIAGVTAGALSEPLYGLICDLLPASDIQHLLDNSVELELLIKNIIGAILTPFIFSLLFIVFQLFTLICFKRISSKIVSSITKNDSTPTMKSKCFGACVGLVTYVIVAAVLTSPLYTILKVTDSISNNYISTAFGEEETQDVSIANNLHDKALMSQTYAIKYASQLQLTTTKFCPISELLNDLVTSYTIPDVAQNENLPDFITVIGDVLNDILYIQNASATQDASSTDLLCNSMAAITPHLDESLTLKYAVTHVLRSLGNILIEERQFMGISLPEAQDELTESIINDILETIANTTLENVKENMILLFGTLDNELLPGSASDEGNTSQVGLIAALIDLQTNYNDDKQAMLQQALKLFGNNPQISSMINELLADYIVSILPSDVEIESDAIKEILDNSTIDFSDIDITNVTQEDVKNIIENNDIEINEDVLDSIRDYLGDDSITEDDVKDYLSSIVSGDNSGDDNSTGDDNVDISDIDISGIDISDIDISGIDIDSLTPEQIAELQEAYGDLINDYLN